MMEPITKFAATATRNSSGCTANFAGMATSALFHGGSLGKTFSQSVLTPSKCSGAYGITWNSAITHPIQISNLAITEILAGLRPRVQMTDALGQRHPDRGQA